MALLPMCPIMAQWSGVPTVQAPPFDAAMVAQDDALRAERGELPLYGRLLPLTAGTDNAGAWRREGDERVWRLRVLSPGALAVELFMDRVSIADGGTLAVYDDEGMLVHGPADAGWIGTSGLYSTPLVPGGACVVEYREPAHATVRGHFTITHVGHAYRDVDEGPCHVDVNCSPEGDAWADVQAAVVRISVVVPAGVGWCTGTLMNNVRQDCEPYVLTAWHCGASSTTAQFNQYKFYFNFRYSGCGAGSYSTAQMLTGAQFKAFSNDNGGNAGSDFMLLRLNSAIPASFQPYYVGWDATPVSTSADDGVCIHHPTGAPKKVSSYTQTLTTGHWSSSSGLQSHWRVRWAATQNGYGVTESGSSGGPLMRLAAAGHPVVIGTLSGSVNQLSCTNPTQNSFFGKMSYHWTNNPNTAAQKLKYWLDPDNTGALVLAGSADPCGAFTGIAEVEQVPALHVFPNPADHTLTIERPSFSAPAILSITDITGREVHHAPWNTDRMTLDVGHWPAGPYMLWSQDAVGGRQHARLMIVHSASLRSQ